MTQGHQPKRAFKTRHTQSLRETWSAFAGLSGFALAIGIVLSNVSPSLARPAQRGGVPVAASGPDCPGGQADAVGGIARWSDVGALVLADGKSLVPEGIALPTRLWPDRRLLALASEAAASVLDGCAIAPAAAAPDRHGRLVGPAGLMCPAAGEGRLEDLATALIRAGAGYATADGNATCVALRLDAEAEARGARRCIWSLATAVAQAGDEQAMEERLGLFSVAEGKVLAAGGRDRIFLNFGARWKQDFTVMLAREDFATILGDRLDPAILRGSLIQVRGVVREEGGPAMAPRRRGEVLRIEGRGYPAPDTQALPSRRRER